MNETSTDLYGLVLAGGHSTRMGTDKAALLYQQQSLLDHAVTTLQRHCTQVWVSTRRDQADALRLRHPCIHDQIAKGPLSGIHAAQNQFAVAWLILAVDMPQVDDRTVQMLIEAWRLDTAQQYDAFALRSAAQQPEPLCSLWTVHSRVAVQTAMQSAQPSPLRALQQLRTRWLDAPDAQVLVNINQPTDYQQLLATVTSSSP